MQGPLFGSAASDRRHTGRFAFFHRIQKVGPFLDLRRINSGFLAKLLVIPEHNWSHIVGQSVGLTVNDEILNAGWIEGVFKLTGDRTGDILADACLDLFLHYAAAPAVEHARAVLRLQKRGQFRFEGLVLEEIELNFDAGMALFVFIRSGSPDITSALDRLMCRTLITVSAGAAAV